MKKIDLHGLSAREAGEKLSMLEMDITNGIHSSVEIIYGNGNVLNRVVDDWIQENQFVSKKVPRNNGAIIVAMYEEDLWN